MKLAVTGLERIGVAWWLQTNAWDGPDADTVIGFGDLHNQLRVSEFRLTEKDGSVIAEGPTEAVEVDLSDLAVRALLAYYPRAASPPGMGPSKAELLRKLKTIAT